MVAPEFQITNDTSVAGFVNYMQQQFNLTLQEHNNIDMRCDYAPLYALVADSGKLLDEINLVIAAGQISTNKLARMKTALDTVAIKDDNGKRNRIMAALTLVIASPEFAVQK